jgi:pimeloyl-ACP methyl ester carboxylesterase
MGTVIAAFVQDKTTIERGLFDEELVPEELTQVRMGKIIKDKYPELAEEDQEAVRQHAIAALNLTQKAKEVAAGSALGDENANTAFVDGVRKFTMDVRELDIDLIDRINPFGEAYAILAKTMSEESLKQVAAVIAAKRTSLSPEEARRAGALRPVLEMLFAEPAAVTKDMIDEILKFKRLDGVEDALAVLRDRMVQGQGAADLRADLHKIPSALVIASRDDRIVGPPDEDALPSGFTVAWIDAAGHIPHLEQAGQVNALLAQGDRVS